MKKLKRFMCLMLISLSVVSSVLTIRADETEETTEDVTLVGDEEAALNSEEMKDIKKFIETARSHIGDPYNRIGTTPQMGFNDFTFIRYVLSEAGLKTLKIPNRLTLYRSCPNIMTAEDYIFPGCIAFFGTNVNYIDHVGIMVNRNTMIHVGQGGVEEIEIPDNMKGHIFVYGQIVQFNNPYLDDIDYDEDPRIQG